MRHRFVGGILASVLMTLIPTAAAAQSVRWNLQNVTFDDGGTANGYFVVTAIDQSGNFRIADWSISVTGGSNANLPPTTFTPASGGARGGRYFNDVEFFQGPVFTNGARVLQLEPALSSSALLNPAATIQIVPASVPCNSLYTNCDPPGTFLICCNSLSTDEFLFQSGNLTRGIVAGGEIFPEVERPQTVTVSYDAAAIFAGGPHSALFHQGDQFHFFYTLDRAVADSNTDPQQGLFLYAVRSLSVSLPGLGVSVLAGSAGNVQTFNDVLDAPSGLVSDQVFFFGGPIASPGALEGEPIDGVEVDFLSPFVSPTTPPAMLGSDALPLYSLTSDDVVVFLHTASGWTYVSVNVAPFTSTLTYPGNGASNADLSQPIQWTNVPNVQAYYLYVGTTIGAKDLVNSGELHQTSYLAAGLPAGQTVYARIWTKVGGVWRYSDSTFSAAALISLSATITSPPNGAVNADLSQPIEWTSVSNVQAYYLYVGTTIGAKDLVNSGELHQTSYLAAGLPAGQTVYARMWTKVGGVWRYSDSTFSAAALISLSATITSPPNGAVNADFSQPIEWTSIPNVQAYYLYVGRSIGAKDLVNSGELHQTSYLAAGLPAGQTVYARMWTKVGGVWRYSDSTFSAAALTVSVSYHATVTFAGGPHSALFRQGDQFHFFYTLDRGVADSNTDPQQGLFLYAVRSLSVSLSGLGVSVLAGPAGNVQTFNDVLDASSGLVSDQVIFFVAPITLPGALEGEAIDAVEVDFLSNFVSATTPPAMLGSDALPLYSLTPDQATIFLHTASGWTQVSVDVAPFM